MHAHRVEVLDRADHHHVVVAVAHQLEFVFLPAVDGLLDQNVRRRGCREPIPCHAFDILKGLRHPRSQTTHREGWPDHHRQTQAGDRLAYLSHGETHCAAGGFATDLGDDVLELLPILAALNGLEVGSDQLHPVALQRPVLVQRHRGVERGLPAEGGQHRVDRVTPLRLLGEDLLDELRRDRLDVGEVRILRVGHDRGRVGVHQAHGQALRAQHSAGLGAGVVELAGLPDHDRPGADDQDVLEVGSAWHLAVSHPCASVRMCAPTTAYRRTGTHARGIGAGHVPPAIKSTNWSKR